MKSVFYMIVLILIFSLPLAGCGGGGAPGSTNSQETDVLIKSANLAVTSPDIDVAIHQCTAGPPPTFESGLTRTDATLNVDATKLDPNNANYDPFPATVGSCTITYLKANEDPAAPVIEQLTVYPNCAIVDGTTTCPVTLMDIERKNRWWDAFSGGTNAPSENPTHYIARYQCTYTTIFGKYGTFEAELDIWLADFNRC